MRVSSEKQTLILAGESVPPRAGTDSPLQRVTMLWVQDFLPPATLLTEPVPGSAAPAELPEIPTPHAGLSAGASAYARTQTLSGSRTRRQVIDTYA